MTPAGLLDGNDVRRLIEEVAAELAEAGPHYALIIAGGSLLAWHGLRAATEDVDTIRKLDEELKSAIAIVAARHDLSVNWLNDHASAFAPFTLDSESCQLLAEYPRLRALGLPLRDLFLMKVRRADPADLNDMRALWPHVEVWFGTARRIVKAFCEAFPDEPADEYLAEFVVSELARGGFDVPLGPWMIERLTPHAARICLRSSADKAPFDGLSVEFAFRLERRQSESRPVSISSFDHHLALRVITGEITGELRERGSLTSHRPPIRIADLRHSAGAR